MFNEVKCSNSNVSLLSGKKVVQILPLDTDEYLVASNDSRIRLMSSSMSLVLKYKGHKANRLPMRADFQK